MLVNTGIESGLAGLTGAAATGGAGLGPGGDGRLVFRDRKTGREAGSPAHPAYWYRPAICVH